MERRAKDAWCKARPRETHDGAGPAVAPREAERNAARAPFWKTSSPSLGGPVASAVKRQRLSHLGERRVIRENLEARSYFLVGQDVERSEVHSTSPGVARRPMNGRYETARTQSSYTWRDHRRPQPPWPQGNNGRMKLSGIPRVQPRHSDARPMSQPPSAVAASAKGEGIKRYYGLVP